VIFREYDIRGLVNKGLTPDVVELIGKAFGTYIDGSVVVGRDNRPSSKPLRDAFVKGLLSTGCDILDIGITATPLLYFSILHYKKFGGVMITGSHNPVEYNGLKLCRGIHYISGNELLKLKKIAESNKFREGKGKISHATPVADYIKMVRKKVKLKKRLKVVVDCGNGTASIVAPRLLRALGCEVIPLYCKITSSFKHQSDPSKPKELKDLVRKVKSCKADLGFDFDADGDRLGVVDDKGRVCLGDELMVIFSRDLLGRKKNAKIVIEVKSSNALVQDIKRYGGIPIMWKTGRSLIKAKMEKEKALFGGEVSGHLFFREDYFGYDDAVFASAKLVGIISNKDAKISDLLDGVPKYYTSNEIRVKYPDAKKFSAVKGLKEYFKKSNKVITIDGARIDFRDGWALVRASNTEPALVLRFEATSKKRLSQIKRIVYSRLR